MKRIILSMLLTFASACLVMSQTAVAKELNVLEKEDLSWTSYSKEPGMKLVHQNDSQKIKVAEIKHDPKDSVDKITYLFINDTLVIYTVTYKPGKKPTLENLCQNWGQCTPVGKSAYTWKSTTGKVQAYSWLTSSGSNELILTFAGVYSSSTFMGGK